jgi:hypothetical protein
MMVPSFVTLVVVVVAMENLLISGGLQYTNHRRAYMY